MKAIKLSLGYKIELELYDNNGDHILPILVSQYESTLPDENIEILAPIHEGRIYPVHRGMRMDVIYEKDGDLFKFSALALERKVTGNVFFLVIKQLSDVEQMQRRSFFRFNSLLDVEFRVFQNKDTPKDERGEFKKAVTRDISGGGICFLSNEKPNYGWYIEAKIKLEREISFIGRIVRVINVHEKGKFNYEGGVELVEITNGDRERVIGFIFDSQRKLITKIIKDLLLSDSKIDVIGTAKNGEEALNMAKELNPDVITLDVEMPIMDGITCLDNLQKQGKYAVIMVSSLSQKRTDATILALEHGAFDFISKPVNVFNLSSEIAKNEIIDKVKLAHRTLKRSIISKQIPINKSVKNSIKSTNAYDLKYIIAVGISTGGPRALCSVIPQFPENIPAAIVIVQHMPPGFTKSLAERLNETSNITVKEAEDGDELKAGVAYVAPGDYHLELIQENTKVKVKLLKTPPIGGLRPNADIMMKSLAEISTHTPLGVIMTGMGSDGSKGLLELKKKKNAYIVAQDESTSVVYGMLRSAIELGIVDKIAPHSEIPSNIMNFMGVHL